MIERNVVEEDRKQFEEKYGDVWNTSELQKDFEVTSFLAPFCMVVRKSDGVAGTLMFCHDPRFYHSFRKRS